MSEMGVKCGESGEWRGEATTSGCRLVSRPKYRNIALLCDVA